MRKDIVDKTGRHFHLYSGNVYISRDGGLNSHVNVVVFINNDDLEMIDCGYCFFDEFCIVKAISRAGLNPNYWLGGRLC